MERAAAPRRLTASEAEALWKAWKVGGDVKARDRLVLAYAPMVRYIAAHKIRELPDHCELDDLVSCGLVAVIEAVSRFDPAKGATFEQFAWTRVRGAIMDELRRQDAASRSTRRVARRVEDVRERSTAATGHAPNERELADALQLSVSELRNRLDEAHRAETISLNVTARHEDAGDGEVGDAIAGPASEQPESLILNEERIRIFRTAIASLSEREAEVFALVHVHQLPGAEIGRRLGVSESRVSQILSGVREKLRAQIAAYDAAAAA